MFGSTAKHLRTYYFQKGQLEQSILRHHTGRELIVIPPLCLHQIKSNSCSAQNRKIGRLISNEARSFFGLPRIRNILIQTWQKFRRCLSFFVSVQNWINRFFPGKSPNIIFFQKSWRQKIVFSRKLLKLKFVFKRWSFWRSRETWPSGVTSSSSSSSPSLPTISAPATKILLAEECSSGTRRNPWCRCPAATEFWPKSSLVDFRSSGRCRTWRRPGRRNRRRRRKSYPVINKSSVSTLIRTTNNL